MNIKHKTTTATTPGKRENGVGRFFFSRCGYKTTQTVLYLFIIDFGKEIHINLVCTNEDDHTVVVSPLSLRGCPFQVPVYGRKKKRTPGPIVTKTKTRSVFLRKPRGGHPSRSYFSPSFSSGSCSCFTTCCCCSRTGLTRTLFPIWTSIFFGDTFQSRSNMHSTS